MSMIRCDFSALNPMTAPLPALSARRVARRRLLRRRQMRLADLGRQVVLGQRALDPRDEIAAIGVIVGMLELAAAAFGKMAARRLLVMRRHRPARRRRARRRPGRRTARGGRLASRRRRAPQSERSLRSQQGERLRNRRGKIVGDHRWPGDLRRAAVEPDRRRRPLRTLTFPVLAAPRSARRAHRPCPRSPATLAPAARSRARPSGDATKVSGPFEDHHRARPAARPPMLAPPSLPGNLAEQLARTRPHAA